MPRQYEAMRDKFAADGLPMKQAKSKAARIYNSKHPKNPVTGKRDPHEEAKADARAWIKSSKRR